MRNGLAAATSDATAGSSLQSQGPRRPAEIAKLCEAVREQLQQGNKAAAVTSAWSQRFK